ncbi:MAG: LysM peptidoglycan-binding domain-containing protein [Candidatus Omnitrophica bacterium]|nr:LysM peptidoglycan-binding domain-containing protein [Candidatus Omnitrophota bacterium]
MIGALRRNSPARHARAILAISACVLLGGCYTRQIEGIQKDLDTLDRKIHSLNLKNKETQSAKGAPSGAALQLEDRLNEVTLKQADMAEELSSLRQNFADVKTGAGASASMTPGDRSSVAALERKVTENSRETQALGRKVENLEKTFDSLRAETKNVIQVLMEEFGEEGSAPSASTHGSPSSGAPTTKSSASSTTVEGPTAGVSTDTAGSFVPDTLPPMPGENKAKVAKASRTYKVRPGDTLSTIAKRFSVSQDEIQELNGLTDPSGLRMGQSLAIP